MVATLGGLSPAEHASLCWVFNRPQLATQIAPSKSRTVPNLPPFVLFLIFCFANYFFYSIMSIMSSSHVLMADTHVKKGGGGKSDIRLLIEGGVTWDLVKMGLKATCRILEGSKKLW